MEVLIYAINLMKNKNKELQGKVLLSKRVSKMLLILSTEKI
jgi:hypothetical protein